MPRLPAALSRLLPSRAPFSLLGAPSQAAASPATEAKDSRTGPLIAYETLGAPVWSGRDYTAFAREGFMQNAIVYRCVRMISEAVASVPLVLYDGPHELEDHPLLSLLAAPSPHQTRTDFLEAFIGYLLVSGNSYVEAVALDGNLRELYALRPDRMRVLPGPGGWPEGYEYTAAGGSVRFEADILPAVRPVLHMRLFAPLDDHYGFSPIEAAATAIDIHNQASSWNKALLDNAARPSGALVYAAREGRLSPEQFERLKSELQDGFQGAKNAGRPLLLEGGLDWKPLSLTPAELDFLNTKHAAAREIALALGVPPQLLGIPGDNTYANYAEANRSFWRSTVIPLATRTAEALATWLAPAFGPSTLRLAPDLDQIEALAPERDALWARLQSATFLTDAEKRAAAGYGLRPGSKYSPDQSRDDHGRWSDGGGSQIAAGPIIGPDGRPIPGALSDVTPVADKPRATVGPTPQQIQELVQEHSRSKDQDPLTEAAARAIIAETQPPGTDVKIAGVNTPGPDVLFPPSTGADVQVKTAKNIDRAEEAVRSAVRKRDSSSVVAVQVPNGSDSNRLLGKLRAINSVDAMGKKVVVVDQSGRVIISKHSFPAK